MKSSNQTNKSTSSTPKNKKSSKDREKRKSQGGFGEVNNHNEKGSPTKEVTRLYAGIDTDSVVVYGEQVISDHLSDEVTSILTEDINYKLRYIINESLVKARLSGKNAIGSADLENTFANLRVEKIYGAPSHPNWVPFGYQNLYYLEDKLVNLFELAEQEDIYHQYSEAIITTKWIPEATQVSKPLKTYFTTICQTLVSSDADLRLMALGNIAQNSRIGPIVEWFYNFAYILLSKDITYDCLTLRALALIRTLENSCSCRLHVSEKQLKLLVRLMLQRLLRSSADVLKPICDVLGLLCQRRPLREFVIVKLSQKVVEVFDNCALAIVTAANYIGIDAIMCFVMNNLHLFLTRVREKNEAALIYSMLEMYNHLVKADLINGAIYEAFCDIFGSSLVMFARPPTEGVVEKKESNFGRVRFELLKTRRKICPKLKLSTTPSIDDVFDLPPVNSKLRKQLEGYDWNSIGFVSDTEVVIGRTSLLLPVFKQKKCKPNFHPCTLLCHNL